MNISHIYFCRVGSGSRLMPLSNVGSNVIIKIESILSELENRPFDKSITFQAKVDDLKIKDKLNPPKGNKKPGLQKGITSHYKRDESVVKWVLSNANGKCESCNNEAPFEKRCVPSEIHHLRRLADKGSDTITNAIAVCPNCHRELHFGRSRDSKLDKLYSKNSRLIRE